MKKKQILVMIFLIIGILAATGTGYYFGFSRGLMAGGLTRSMTDIYLFHEHMTDQMENADCEDLKQALNDYLMLLEKHKNDKEGLVSDTVYYGDNMLTHMRLALISQALNNLSETDLHIRFAIAACKQRGWKDCSDAKLFQYVKKRDEKIPIQCLSKLGQERK